MMNLKTSLALSVVALCAVSIGCGSAEDLLGPLQDRLFITAIGREDGSHHAAVSAIGEIDGATLNGIDGTLEIFEPGCPYYSCYFKIVEEANDSSVNWDAEGLAAAGDDLDLVVVDGDETVQVTEPQAFVPRVFTIESITGNTVRARWPVASDTLVSMRASGGGLFDAEIDIEQDGEDVTLTLPAGLGPNWTSDVNFRRARTCDGEPYDDADSADPLVVGSGG
jgi:hypothetical protein